MISHLRQRTVARVLFDEAHSEAWSIRQQITRAIQPAHPADSSLAAAAGLLGARGFDVRANATQPLDATTLAGADVLVIAHPSDPKWERTVPGALGPVFSAAELDAIAEWVHAGGGLIVLAESEQDKYGTNLTELLQRFGVGVEHTTVTDYEHHRRAPSWVLAETAPAARDGVDLLAGVRELCFYRAGALRTTAPHAQVLARSAATADPAGAELLVAIEHGAGRVVVAADSDLFGDDCLEALDHARLWCNLVTWAAQDAIAEAGRSPVAGSGAEPPAAWQTLHDHTAQLRLAQRPDGSANLTGHDEGELREHVEAMASALEELRERFPHQDEYLAAAATDLRGWAAEGFGKPDFAASLGCFRPDLQREDGIEHIVLFPMYKQNASRDTAFEALHVRVPWPQWLAELERTRYDNRKFVPVTFAGQTAGYDSECAVLFPETVSVAGPPANHFGAIFADREAERFRRVTAAAAEILSLDLPPEAAALVSSPGLSQDAFLLWDLIHDRAHGRGDLPFDPFMIRQRMPYWMYALEELRCDLTAFAESVALEREGFAFARNVQYAILFDRLFRFPVTGTRVRNYDGLGGQLLFAHLHRQDIVRWTDNRLHIAWDEVADGVAGLRDQVLELYRDGIDRSKLAQWGAAHDLISRVVRPADSSAWAAARRDFPEVEDPRPYIDEVLPDEFPLSMFYSSLRQRLAPALERPVAVAA